MKYFVSVLLIAAFSVLVPLSLSGQQEEVRVVKPYTPTLSGAEKIQLLPSLDEEVAFESPGFTYQLFPKRYDSEFRVEPISAARMVQAPLKKLYKSQLTMGLGNYLTPLAELNISQLRSRRGTFGLNLKHHSMNGKVKLDTEPEKLKAAAGFNENMGEVFGNRFLRNAVFEYKAGASYNSYVHYGVDPDLDTVLAREDALHPYFTAAGAIGLHSMHADSLHFNYNTGLGYHYFTHRFDMAEHAGTFDFTFDRSLRAIDIAGDAGFEYYHHEASWDTLVGNQAIIRLNPHVAKGSAEWRFTAGVNIYSEITGGVFTPHFYPRATFQFNIVREVIVPYLGVEGYLESNSLRKTVEENPYVVPGLAIEPVNHKLVAYAGLKGRFSDALAWNLKGSYSIIDNQHYFVNDTSTELKNQFRVIYDDLTMVNVHGEFTIRPSDPWKIFLKGNYYSYLMVREDHPWHHPDFDLSLQVRYNLSDKILVNSGIFAIGPRYYKVFEPGEEPGKLPLAVDANLGVEYRYSNLLSFWANVNNLAAQKYYLYNQYPSYRFRIMLGLSYSL
ncbi:MAG TPA: hypothetical protein ENO05_11040 [Bacteroides sp.]|nr:hypothetical protein [Bacteroides sp.]